MFYRTQKSHAALAAFVVIGALGANGAALAQTAPPLGSAASFGVAASTFTNTNAVTAITGNVCFTTGPGTAYGITGTQTVPCTTQVADQNAALADLNGQTCTPIGAAVALESFDPDNAGPIPAGTFIPGCYSTTGTMSITTGTTVTLSGSGVYIFRAAGGLSPAVGSAIALTNGASAANVFWAPTAATTFGANVNFAGTVIDDAGITFGAGAILNGRALATGGTITMAGNTVTVPGSGVQAAGIPTLSEWAMIILATIMAGGAVWTLQRRQSAQYMA